MAHALQRRKTLAHSARAAPSCAASTHQRGLCEVRPRDERAAERHLHRHGGVPQLRQRHLQLDPGVGAWQARGPACTTEIGGSGADEWLVLVQLGWARAQRAVVPLLPSGVSACSRRLEAPLLTWHGWTRLAGATGARAGRTARCSRRPRGCCCPGAPPALARRQNQGWAHTAGEGRCWPRLRRRRLGRHWRLRGRPGLTPLESGTATWGCAAARPAPSTDARLRRHGG